MNSFARFVLAVVCGAALFFVAAGPAASAPAKPLRISITSTDSKPTVKLARQISILSTCSKTCRARVDLILRTPSNTLRLNRVGRRVAESPWATTVALSQYGFDYLSMVWRSASLKVVVTAIDLATSSRTVRTRTFRLSRR